MSPLEFLIIVAVVIGIPALILGSIRKSNPGLAHGKWPTHWQFSIKVWHIVYLIAAILSIVVAVSLGGGAGLFFLASLLILGYYLYCWQREFLFLMGLRDDQFPGRHDKLIWAFTLIALGPIGLWIFRSYHLANWPEVEYRARPYPGKPAPDLF